jgi:hypothetical protein
MNPEEKQNLEDIEGTIQEAAKMLFDNLPLEKIESLDEIETTVQHLLYEEIAPLLKKRLLDRKQERE